MGHFSLGNMFTKWKVGQWTKRKDHSQGFEKGPQMTKRLDTVSLKKSSKGPQEILGSQRGSWESGSADQDQVGVTGRQTPIL